MPWPPLFITIDQGGAAGQTPIRVSIKTESSPCPLGNWQGSGGTAMSSGCCKLCYDKSLFARLWPMARKHGFSWGSNDPWLYTHLSAGELTVGNQAHHPSVHKTLGGRPQGVTCPKRHSTLFARCIEVQIQGNTPLKTSNPDTHLSPFEPRDTRVKWSNP